MDPSFTQLPINCSMQMFGTEIFRRWLSRCLVKYDEMISRHDYKCTSCGIETALKPIYIG